MNKSILVVLNDMPCSKLAVEFLAQTPLHVSEVQVTLIHVFRKPTGSEEMMGKKFMQAQQEKIQTAMTNARQRLMEAGFPKDQIQIRFETNPYATVADGILAEVSEGGYDIVVIGRKNMSKTEEFVLGDASIKLIRELKRATVIVVKC